MRYSHTPAKFFTEDGEPRDAHTLWEKAIAWFRIPTPQAATSDEWELWERDARANYPIRYFVNWTLRTQIKIWQRRLITDPVWWVRYRTINRNHVLRVHTIKPGWMEPSDFILHSSFQLLVNHVEQGLAGRNYKWFEENKVRRWRCGRYPEAGIAHLNWEINEPECYHGTPGETQGDYAQIKLELYDWWTRLRPLRMEPWSDSRIWKDRSIEALTDLSGSIRGYGRKESGEQAMLLEQLHTEEDQEMLKKLVHIRPGLWS